MQITVRGPQDKLDQLRRRLSDKFNIKRSQINDSFHEVLMIGITIPNTNIERYIEGFCHGAGCTYEVTQL